MDRLVRHRRETATDTMSGLPPITSTPVNVTGVDTPNEGRSTSVTRETSSLPVVFRGVDRGETITHMKRNV